MNAKIKKLQADRRRNEEKIDVLRHRNAEIDKQIRELENLDIVDMVRNRGMTPAQLQALLRDGGNAHA